MTFWLFIELDASFHNNIITPYASHPGYPVTDWAAGTPLMEIDSLLRGNSSGISLPWEPNCGTSCSVYENYFTVLQKNHWTLALLTLLIHFTPRIKQEETVAPKWVLLKKKKSPSSWCFFFFFLLNIETKIEEWLWFLAWMTWGRARLTMETDRQETPQAECISSGVRPPD